MTASHPFPPELLAELSAWLRALGRPASALEPLAGDVSLRRYVRVRLAAGESAIAAYYPEAIRPAQLRFEAAAALLEGAGVRVPRRFACDAAHGWSLVEDLGEATLYDQRHEGWAWLEGELAHAVDLAGRIAALDRHAVEALGSPPLDRPLLRRELAQTESLVLAPAGLAGEPAAELARALDRLCAALAAEPAVSCHRDLMARNLVRTPEGLGVLDFQDLRLGPPGYDLASLLNDSLFPPREVEARLLERATGSRRPRAGYRRAVAQRALKAAGTYAAFAARGDGRHLALIAPTLERASRHLLRLPETRAAWLALLERAGTRLGLGAPLLH